MLVLLFALILTWSLIVRQYYKRQNNNQKTGGPISVPKALWLGYAMFFYFLYPVWLYFLFQYSSSDLLFLHFILLCMYARLIFQAIWMFRIKKWTPPMGITFNLASVILIIIVYIYSKLLFGNHVFKTLPDTVIMLYALNVVCILLVDTYYANTFYKIVGSNTKGDNAIWFASTNDQRFNKINRITTFSNMGFYTYSIIVIAYIIYGEFILQY